MLHNVGISSRHRLTRLMVLTVFSLYLLVGTLPPPADAAQPFVGANVEVAGPSSQDETTIAVNPTNVQNLVGGANDYRNGGSTCGVYNSTDRGQTWADDVLPEVSGFSEAGDPIVDFDDGGTAYYLCMNFNRDSGGGGINHTQFVRTSTDGGQNWGAAVEAMAASDRDDKGAMAVDDMGANTNVYVSATRFGGSRRIVFNRSTDSGATFSATDTTIDDAGTAVQGSSIAVGSDGDVYVAWADSTAANTATIMIDKSTDQGQNFGALLGGTDHVVRTFDPIGNPGGTGIRPLTRVNSFPVIATHPTAADTLYAVWAEDPVGTDDSDIMFARSTDGGNVWGAPVRVNDDTNPATGFNSQFFPWMSVDPIDGEIDIVWYSDQNDADQTDGTPLVDLYFASSMDDGVSFGASARVSTQSSDTTTDFGTGPGDTFFGDYNGIDSRDGIAHALWTDSRDGDQDAYYATIGEQQADLSLTKSDSADPVAAGDEFDYTITVANDGPFESTNTTVTDTLPSEVEYVSSSEPSCSEASGVVTCNIGSVASGGSESFTIRVRTPRDLVYDNGGPLTITNEAEVDSDQADPDTSNNSDTETTQVVARADLEIVSFDAQNPPTEMLVGDPQSVTLRKVITNNGPSAPMDVRLDRTGLASSGATVTPTSSSSVELALDYQEEREVNETFTIECQAPGPHTFTFTNEIQPNNAADEDPNQTNNTASESFTVNCITPVIINIKPGSSENPVNLRSVGVIPVGILTTSAGEYGLPLAFDATKINASSLRFGKREVVLAGGGAPEAHGMIHPEDVYELDEMTKDGDLDVMTHYRTQLTQLTESDTEACARGTYSDGLMTFTFFGCDKVRTMP